MRRALLSVVVLAVLSLRASSQFQTPPDSLPMLAPISPEDSARIVNSLAGVKAARIDTTSSAYTSTKSPGVALLLSAVLPGAGQFYNESYWKVPVVLGFGVYFASSWLDNNRRTQDYREQYSKSITDSLPGGDGNLLRLREFYKDQRDTFSWYFFIYYIVNLVDAYVDASLYDFNVGDDLSIHIRPEFDFRERKGPQVSIKVKF